MSVNAVSGSLDFELPPELSELAARATELGTGAAASREFPDDSWLIGNSREFSKVMAEQGWLGMTWPTEWGGHGRSPLERFVVVEALIATGAPIATSWFADRQIGPTLLQFGSDEQRRRHLGDIVSGTSAWCIGMSEPDAGSDVSSIRTSAVRADDTWIINGSKVWTSGADDADWCYLIARTDPDAPRHKSLSEFIVDMRTPGIEVRPIRDATGNEHFCEVILNDVVVPAEALVGTENESFGQVMRQMEHERGGIDRLLSNRGLYELALGRIDRSDPLVRQEVAVIESGYRIGRHMVLREVTGQAPKGWSALTKTLCTELEVRIADFAANSMGAEALIWNRFSRGICYAPAYTLMGGTTQILRNIIAERALGLPRDPR